MIQGHDEEQCYVKNPELFKDKKAKDEEQQKEENTTKENEEKQQPNPEKLEEGQNERGFQRAEEEDRWMEGTTTAEMGSEKE